MATIDDLIQVVQQLTLKVDSMLTIMRNSPRIQIDNAIVTDPNMQVNITGMDVPDGQFLTIESDFNNSGIISIAPKDNRQKVKKLRRGENAYFQVTSPAALYITGDTIGDVIVVYAESK